MDPNALLDEIRKLSEQIVYQGGGNRFKAEELAYKIADLDRWLSGGGFPPSAWNAQSTGRRTMEEQTTP